MFPLIVADIPPHLKPVDAEYFRRTREARFGKSLEEVVAGRDKTVEGFSQRPRADAVDFEDATLSRRQGTELRRLHRVRAFQWARVVSTFKLLAEDDPVYAWRNRLLDAFDGMGTQIAGL